jgi:putative exosortase-associated protein (TIGR04073 family)
MLISIIRLPCKRMRRERKRKSALFSPARILAIDRMQREERDAGTSPHAALSIFLVWDHFSNCQKSGRLIEVRDMKKVLLLSAALLFGAILPSQADIHDPPGNDFGPTRKLGRSISNMMYCWLEIPNSVTKINTREGNLAAFTYGPIQGVGGTIFRLGAGVYEFVAFPFPTYKATYRPFYKSDTHWIHGGHSEFPPDVGFETHTNYVRSETAY